MESAVRIQEFDDPNYDPFNSDEINFGDHADPYPLIARWRAEAPVIEGGYRPLMGLPAALYPDRKMFTVVGSSEVNEVLTDTDRFSNAGYKFNLGVTFGQGSISTMDNPEHGRWRGSSRRYSCPNM
ncbi:hypothetical protein ACFSTI_25390 [Rhizorhabdus histidinilytica]